MRHRSAHRKLGRTTAHRKSLLRNLAASLIDRGRIRTTVAKAKELRPFVEKLVTLGKRDSLHARRRALSILPRKEAVQKLFSDVSPRFSERPGGYTRILKLHPRPGDGAPMAFIQFVDYKFEGASPGAAPAAKEKPEKKAPKPEPEEAKEPEVEEAAADAGEGKKKPARKKATKKTTMKTAAKKKTSAKKTPSKKKKD
jgi:large subunit ribosomal protein L17